MFGSSNGKYTSATGIADDSEGETMGTGGGGTDQSIRRRVLKIKGKKKTRAVESRT